MKATGIVRRVDELGRVVIPKELRRKLKWRAGAPVEIFTASDGIVSLKRFSSMGEDAFIAQKLADSIAQTCGCVVFISDMDRVLAVSGCPKSQLMDKDISQELENAINARKVQVTENMPMLVTLDERDHMYPYAVVAPIISEGDTEGAVVIMSQHSAMNETEVKLAKTVAAFLSDRLTL